MLFKHCLICNSYISHKDIICKDCNERFELSNFKNNYSYCKDCGYPLISTDYKCIECDNRKGNYIFSLYDYRDSFAKEILERYKFYNDKKFSKLFALKIQKYVEKYDLIVPVPSSSLSLKKRGWDQMKQISKYLNNVKVEFLIQNNFKDIEQKKLNRNNRISNSLGKYSVVKNDLDKNVRILVIDDITTTGSTLVNCIDVLKQSGFLQVHGFAIYAQI